MKHGCVQPGRPETGVKDGCVYPKTDKFDDVIFGQKILFPSAHEFFYFFIGPCSSIKKSIVSILSTFWAFGLQRTKKLDWTDMYQFYGMSWIYPV